MVSADETAVTYLEIPDKSENDKKHYKYECIMSWQIKKIFHEMLLLILFPER